MRDLCNRNRMVSSKITVLLLAAAVGLSESHKNGVHRPASVEETWRFGMPDNAVIIADLNSLRLQVSYTEEAAEHMCKAIESARKCMNVSEDEPMYSGSDCAGTECHMLPHPGPALCMGNMSNLRMDLSNTTRQLTCGLDPEDDAVIHPEIPNLGPPTSNAHKHIIGLPKGIDIHIWHVCLRGKYHDVIRVQFSEAPAYRYECKEYPLCIGGNVHARGFCYSTAEFLAENVSSAGQEHIAWWWLLVVLLVYLFDLGYKQ